MKSLLEYLQINEKIADDKNIDFNSPVMFSIYGDSKGPWYFGYKLKDKDGIVGSLEDRQISYPKLVVDFDKFDPKKLENNK